MYAHAFTTKRLFNLMQHNINRIKYIKIFTDQVFVGGNVRFRMEVVLTEMINKICICKTSFFVTTIKTRTQHN